MIATSILDFAASVALLWLLVEAYGAFRRRFAGIGAAPIILGFLFGLLAILEMSRPFEPVSGVLIDLRCIPIALAGAFLGWRGLLPAMGLAVFARLELGGVGATAGAFGIVIAGLAGMIWARKMAIHQGRGVFSLVCLALAMSSHLLAAVVMPNHLAIWFFANAAGPLFVTNLFVVTLIGSILQREGLRVERKNLLAGSLSTGSAPPVLRGYAFSDAVKSAFAAKPLEKFAGFLILGPRYDGFAGLWQRLFPAGSDVPNIPLSCLKGSVEHFDLIGRSADGRCFVPLSESEVRNGRHLTRKLGNMVAANRTRSGLAQMSGLRRNIQVLPVDSPSQFLRIVDCIAQSPKLDLPRLQSWHSGDPEDRLKGQPRKARIFNPKEHDGLFAKANILMGGD